MPKGKVVAIGGIDTDIGKSIVTGLMAKYLLDKGHSVITQKICQTGCTSISEDIVTHRKIMGIELCDVDRDGLTCPYVFPEPCSPHLAARLVGQVIDPEVIKSSTMELQKRYDFVLLEGVGGLMVPLREEYLLIDYLSAGEFNNVLVSTPRLGSINHTLSAIELYHMRKMHILGIVYNLYYQSTQVIMKDSQEIFRTFLANKGYSPQVIEVGNISTANDQNIPDFSNLFKGLID